MSTEITHYVDDFEALKGNGQPQSILRMKQDAFDCFRSMEFPSIHEEEWRFTNVAPMLKIPFRNALRSARVGCSWDAIAPLVPARDGDRRIVFLNGRYSKELSDLPSAFTLTSLAEGLRSHAAEDYLGRCVRFDENAFTAMNAAFLREGAFVRLPDGAVENTPVHLVYASARIEDAVAFPRNLIVLGKNSRASIIESYINLSGSRIFNDAVTEMILGEGSALQHVRIQRESRNAFHIATTRVRQSRDSAYSSFAFTLGSSLSRESLATLLEDQGASCSLNGLYLAGSDQLMDHHTTIDHSQPHGTSRELYKGILSGRSRVVFNGRIIVRKDAQHTDARQSNKNILLADSARINTTPQLEILADDVKCNHGATIGHLDDDALFYLRSRGIGEESARFMLMRGFLQEVTARVQGDSLQQALDSILDSRLAEFTGGRR